MHRFFLQDMGNNSRNFINKKSKYWHKNDKYTQFKHYYMAIIGKRIDNN
jgi:hypothetical protein